MVIAVVFTRPYRSEITAIIHDQQVPHFPLAVQKYRQTLFFPALSFRIRAAIRTIYGKKGQSP